MGIDPGQLFEIRTSCMGSVALAKTGTAPSGLLASLRLCGLVRVDLLKGPQGPGLLPGRHRGRVHVKPWEPSHVR